MKSNRFTLNLLDVKKIAKNGFIFLAPVLITELTLLTKGVSDWRIYMVALEVWLLGVMTDTLRKFSNGK